MAHLHEVLDDDPHFKIDDESRKITLTSEKDPILIQNDHNSERFTFEIPKLVDGHDMELCDEVRVHFINIDAENPDVTVLGLYKVDDFRVSTEDPSTMLFSWLIAREATTLVGTVSFVVEFICKNGDNIIDYSWHTDIYSGVIVAKSIDNTEVIIGQYYDTLNEWIVLIDQAGDRVRTDVLKRIDDAADQAETSSKERINAHAEEVKQDLTVYGLDVSDVLVQETGNDPDKIISQKVVTKELNVLDAKLGTHKTDVTAEINQFKTEITDAINKANAYEEVSLSETTVLGSTTYNGAEIEFDKTYLLEDKVSTSWTFILHIQIEYFRVTNGTDNTVTYPNGTITENLAYEFEYSQAREGYGTLRLLPKDGVHLGGGKVFIPLKFNDKYYPIERTYDANPGNYSDSIVSVTARVWGHLNKFRLFKYRPYPALQQTGFLVNANGISKIEKTKTELLTHTYTITLDDGTTTTFEVKDGVGISNFALSERGDYEDTYRIDLTDGTNKTFKVPNNNAVGIVTSDSGPMIHAEDLIPLDHVIRTKVRSKNMIPYPWGDGAGIETSGKVEKDGVTYTIDGDKTIILNGTAAYNTSFNVLYQHQKKVSVTKGKTYTFSCVSGLSGSRGYMFLQIYVGGESKKTYTIRNNDVVTFTSEYDGYVSIGIVLLSGVTFDNDRVQIQLEEGDTVTSYTPYVDLTTVTLTRCSKNLIAHPYYANTTEYNGITITDNAGILTFNGTATADSAYTLFRKSTIPIDGKYTLSGVTGGSATTFYMQPYVNGVAQGIVTNGPVTYEWHGSITQISIFFKAGTSFDNLIISPQLEVGDTATEFERYRATTHGLTSNGGPVPLVESDALPIINLLTGKEGVIIDATYNVDQTAAYNKMNKLLETLLNGGA